MILNIDKPSDPQKDKSNINRQANNQRGQFKIHSIQVSQMSPKRTCYILLNTSQTSLKRIIQMLLQGSQMSLKKAFLYHNVNLCYVTNNRQYPLIISNRLLYKTCDNLTPHHHYCSLNTCYIVPRYINNVFRRNNHVTSCNNK